MRVIIAGSRTFQGSEEVAAKIDHLLRSCINPIIISGTASGADKFGERYAASRGYEIERYPADWNKHGRSAGYKRNLEMGEIADVAIVIWDGVSRGSKHMIQIMQKLKKPVRIINF